MAPSVVSFCKELIEVQEARHLERSIMVDFNNNFIPLGIVGNDNFLRGYSIYHTAFPINEIETVQTTNLQLQIKSVNRFSILHWSPQNNWHVCRLLARPRLRFLIISPDLWLLYFDNGVSIPHLTVYHETLFTDLHDMNISSFQVPHTFTWQSKIHLSIVLLSITQLCVISWKLPIPRWLQILVFLLFFLCS